MIPTILPTPVQATFSGRTLSFSGFSISKECAIPPYAFEMGERFYGRQGKTPLVFRVFSHPNNQAYRLTIAPDAIIVEGAGPAAFIYATATLLQIAIIRDDAICLPEGSVLDYPEFAVRSVNWLLFVECRSWSQDDGDGLDALFKRVVSALDTLAYFKLNGALIDGFGWNPERFLGYAAFMRRLAAEASRRFIHLGFGGYNAGYGAQWHDFDGPKFQNKTHYPDGEVYPCISPEMKSDIGATMGTCLSNQALRRLKCENIREFVRAVQPGLLYIHGLDISSRDGAKGAWATRCPECRKRWPNDESNAPDGMAGAFADFYDELYEAIASVKDQESDYDAARDCVVVMPSPNYSSCREDDAEWAYHTEYFHVLSGCLRNQTLQPMLREQFIGHDTQKRISEMRAAIGEKQGLSIVLFSSGDGFYNSLPCTADPSCAKYFRGANTVVTGFGNAFQEPRQAMTAEYLWNPIGTRFPVDYPEESYEAFMAFYRNVCHGQILPEAVFGKEGLLPLACRKLYGDEAGAMIEPFLRPQTVTVGKTTFAIAPIAPACNRMLPGTRFSIYHRFGNRIHWHKDLNDELIERACEWTVIMEQIVEKTEQAELAYKAAADKCRSPLPLQPDMRSIHLKRMAVTFNLTVKLGRLVIQWLRILPDAYDAYKAKNCPDALLERIEQLKNAVTAAAAPLKQRKLSVIDLNGADIGQALFALDFLLDEAENISHTLRTGEFRDAHLTVWW
ncbi:MAG: hypothetical protein IKP00_11550 [Victivallales bacterium]|nr:hypothetical protein [Victivallales bacterium]